MTKFLDSLRGKIFLTLHFLTSILILVMVFIVISLNTMMDKYAETTDQLLMIYNVSSISEVYVEDYLKLIQNINTSSYKDTFDQNRTELENAGNELNIAGDKELLTQVSGIQNIIEKMNDLGDEGYEAALGGDLPKAYDIYEQLGSYKYFINENTAKLSLLQLQEDTKIAKSLEADREKIMYIILGIGFAAILFSGIFSSQLSKSISKPLLDLSIKVKIFAEKNYQDVDLGGNLTLRRDEVGILARSFEEMRKKLVKLLSVEKTFQEKLLHANEQLANNNKELEELNNALVGREMKMIELKNEIDQLRSRISSQP